MYPVCCVRIDHLARYLPPRSRPSLRSPLPCFNYDVGRRFRRGNLTQFDSVIPPPPHSSVATIFGASQTDIRIGFHPTLLPRKRAATAQHTFLYIAPHSPLAPLSPTAFLVMVSNGQATRAMQRHSMHEPTKAVHYLCISSSRSDDSTHTFMLGPLTR